MEKSVLATVAGAVLAALGYVAKQLADFLTAYVATKRARQAKLLKLHSLLRAGRVIYEVQNDLTRTWRERFVKIIRTNCHLSSKTQDSKNFFHISIQK